MPIPNASPDPSDAAATARILRAKSPVLPGDFAKLDAEAKKRAITVTDEVSLDAIRSMRDALARAKRDGIEYSEFVKTVGPTIHAQWGIDSPQLKTVFVNNVQQAANQAIVTRLNRQRGKFPFWTLDVVKDEVTSATCSYFITHPVVLPAGHSWFATNAPMRHHRCRSTLRGLTAAEARKIGISKTPPDWPAEPGWGGSAPMGEYKANMSDVIAMADGPAKYSHIDFAPPKGAQEEAKRGLEWRREFGRGGTAVGIARSRDLANGTRLSPSTMRRMKAFFDRHEVDKKGKGFSPGEEGFPSNGRIAWALWGGDAGYAWARKVVAQMNSADKKAKTMKDKTVKNDLGQADVHVDGPMKVRRSRTMKPITTPQRNSLPGDKFALPAKRAYPIHDAAHARNAMARLEQNKGALSEAEYEEAKRNILKAYKRFGIKQDSKTLTKRFKGLTFRTNAKMTSIHVHHMRDSFPVVMRGEDALFPGIALGAELVAECKATKAADGEEIDISKWSPPKWNQLAKVGTFKGHPSGPFELTPVIFDEIVRNFNATINRRAPIDYEHASEQPSTEGSIPTQGAPAHGWIIAMENRGRDGLWGLTTLHPDAAQKVREGQYMFFSPAIRFGSRDRESGQPIGARMTSGALTNNPFLDGMKPFLASDRGGMTPVNTEIQTNMGDYVYGAAEMAPKLRACLFDPGSHQATMGTLAECYDAICRIEALVDEFRGANPDADLMTAKHAGIDLGGALARLRDAMQMGLGMTVPEMLAIVKEMIETAIGVHEEEMHEEEIPPSSREMGNTTMADHEITIKLRDAENKLATLMGDLQARDTEVAGLKLTRKDRDATIASQTAELVMLRDNEKKRAEADEAAAINTAFATYQDAKKLTDLDKQQMLLTYRGDRDLFYKLYPTVAPDQRHLMRQIAPKAMRPSVEQGTTDARAIVGGGGKNPDEMLQLADKYQQEGMSREAALSKAYNDSVTRRSHGQAIR